MEGSTKVEMMSLYEAKTAKRVYLYRNGATNSQPKCLVVNDRQVRDFSTFLNRATSGLKAPVAIRNIYTPSGGHKVKHLNDLRSGHYYVAGGAEHFKKVKYGDSPQKLLSRRPPRTELLIPHRAHQAVVASARYKKPVEKPFVIHVFRNGDERYRGARVLLTRRIMGSWEHVLEIVADKVNLFTPAKRLCTLDGRTLHAVSELQDGGKYVAIEGARPFQRVSYCATDEKRLLRHTTLPRTGVRLRRRSERHHHTDSEQPDGDLNDSSKVPFLTMSLQRRTLKRRQSRPMAGRKNKEAREKAIADHRADSIFGGSPTNQPPSLSPSPRQPQPQQQTHPLAGNHKQTPKAIKPTPHMAPLETTHAASSRVSPEIERKATTTTTTTSEVPAAGEDLMSSKGSSVSKKTGRFHASSNNTQAQKQHSQEHTEDSQGESAVFKAKAGGGSSEVEGAEVVVESGDTEVERPVDLEEAQEVEEEKEDKEGTEIEATQDVELKTQPLQTSIDLSLNRNSLQDTPPLAASTPPPPPKDPTPAASSSTASIPHSHTSSKTSSSVKTATESATGAEEGEVVEQSRTHSVLSKKDQESVMDNVVVDGDGSDGDVPEEIVEDIVAVEEEEKQTEGKPDISSEEQQQRPQGEEEVVEEIDEEQEGQQQEVEEGSVADQSPSEPQPPPPATEETEVPPHTDSPPPEELQEEVKDTATDDVSLPDDGAAEVPEEVMEEEVPVEEVEQETGSAQEEHKDSTTSQPEIHSEPDTATFVVEDPTS